MLNILVDEAYAFDFLSILDVKLSKHYAEQTKRYRECVNNMLKKQLGDRLVDQILNSNEYAACIAANNNMFELVDKAKKDIVTAREVDYGNYERCKAKNALQIKFFGSTGTEVKTGYDTYIKNK